MLKWKKFRLGFLETNCYVIYDTEAGNGIIVDPAIPSEDVKKYIEEEGVKIQYIINTHGHFDHIGGNLYFKDLTGAKIAIHREDAHMLTDPLSNHSEWAGVRVISPAPDIIFNNEEELNMKGITLKIIHAPGHTMGSICILVNNELILTGDTLFCNSIGRSDLPESAPQKMKESLDKIKKLSPHLWVLPGHAAPAKLAVILEKNPYLV